MSPRQYSNSDLIIVPVKDLVIGDVVRSIPSKECWGAVVAIGLAETAILWDGTELPANLPWRDRGRRLDILRVKHPDEVTKRLRELSLPPLTTGARDYLRNLVAIDNADHCTDEVYVEVEAFLQ